MPPSSSWSSPTSVSETFADTGMRPAVSSVPSCFHTLTVPVRSAMTTLPSFATSRSVGSWTSVVRTVRVHSVGGIGCGAAWATLPAPTATAGTATASASSAAGTARRIERDGRAGMSFSRPGG